VGRQIPLGDFPINLAVHRSGDYVAVLHSGYGAHQILVVDLRTGTVVSTNPVHEAFYGLEFSRDGRSIYCSGAGDEVVHQWEFAAGVLSGHRQLVVRPRRERGVPAGLALDEAGGHVFSANVWGNSISRLPLAGDGPPTEIVVEGAGAGAWPATNHAAADSDTAAAEKRAEAAAQEGARAGAFPYACRIDAKARRLYASLWGQAAVAVVDLDSLKVIARWATGEHPCEMALTRAGGLLYVANSSRNTVSVFDTAAGRLVETLNTGLYPQAPPGSTPNSLALAPDERTLFVANADNNAVAVFDVSTPGRARSYGFIPVGWYPTSVRVTPDGRRLLVTNGKGLAPKPNPYGPQPGVGAVPGHPVEYIGSLLPGALSVIDLPAKRDFERQMAEYTVRTFHSSPLKPDGTVTRTPVPGGPIPARPGAPSPIQHVIYVIKENRTYDQILGDLPQGNGDPRLCLFPEHVTPNFHKLAREFVLLDNFYVDAEVSADGHEWTMGAYATDFVEKMWPLSYGHNQSGKFPYPSEGNYPAAYPASGYLWDRAREAGVTYRSYGEFVQNSPSLTVPATTHIAALRGHFDEWYRTFDLNYPDAKRADRFIGELKRFEKGGEMPRLQILRLPNDHTHGASAGALTPVAYVGDNDLALGRVIEALSQSRFWPHLAVFVVEDDAQNGPDHVDAHRTTAFVISPYARRHAVDSTLYSTTSMLRTIELILGLRPMSQFDAAAAPMYASFQATPDFSAYQALPANVDLTERNSKTAWGAALRLNFAREDAVNDRLLNELIWRSVRGQRDPLPAPVRAAFVRPIPAGRDDD